MRRRCDGRDAWGGEPELETVQLPNLGFALDSIRWEPAEPFTSQIGLLLRVLHEGEGSWLRRVHAGERLETPSGLKPFQQLQHGLQMVWPWRAGVPADLQCLEASGPGAVEIHLRAIADV